MPWGPPTDACAILVPEGAGRTMARAIAVAAKAMATTLNLLAVNRRRGLERVSPFGSGFVSFTRTAPGRTEKYLSSGAVHRRGEDWRFAFHPSAKPEPLFRE